MPPKKTKVQPKDRSQTKKTINITPPQLTRLEFTRHEVPIPPKWGRVPLDITFGLARPSPDRLGVELNIGINGIPAFSVAAGYRMILRFDGDMLPEEVEREMHSVGVQLGLTTLFPYLREAISTTIVRAGLPPLTLPPMNLRGLLNPDNITIPPPPSDELDINQTIAQAE